MLVFTRKNGQSFVIKAPDGERRVRITLTNVLGFSSGAKIGIEAPMDWEIVRSELLPADEQAAAVEPSKLQRRGVYQTSPLVDVPSEPPALKIKTG